MKKKVMIAMSGGVDSSVTAYLIKKQNFDCIGVTMKLFDNDDCTITTERSCCSIDDVNDARAVADKLDVPYYVFNFKDNFKTQVIDRFIQAYENGATPNPCIDCNRYLKFDKLFERAKQLEYDFIATGHYAQIEFDSTSGRYLLKKACDPTKDQSYVLYMMTQEMLSRTIFPLGNLPKTKTREIALEQGFINAKKQDSQDICFVPDGDYARFIEQTEGKIYPKGEFLDIAGNVLGEHNGIIRYTIGQRKGLGISSQSPLYVCKKDLQKNTITLGSNEDLFSKELFASDLNLIAVDKILRPTKMKARIRYKQEEQDVVVEQLDEDRIHVEFSSSVRAVAKGQAVVLYDGDIVIGGATIS